MYDEVFIDVKNLPKPLSKAETIKLLDEAKQGEQNAIKELAEHNIRLVIHEVFNKFKTFNDKKELISIGNLGLIKAITTFDKSKKTEFSTYAAKCIDNEILMYLRKQKKHQKVDSLEKPLTQSTDGKEIKIEDTLTDSKDITEDYEKQETYRIIREVIEELPERERKLIMLHYGFYDDKPYTQMEIAKIMSISQSYTSRLIKRAVNKIGKKLNQKGIIELRMNKIKMKGKKDKMSRRLRTIYEYFSDYTKEQIDAMIETLSNEEKELLTKRYGIDLENPTGIKLNKEENNKYYGTLIPKMRKLLKSQNKPKQIKKAKTKETLVTIPNETPNITSKLEEQVLPKQTAIDTIEKDDYIKLMELLRTPIFTKMLTVYSPKEIMISSLKLGYIDGKCFSNKAISEFLGIDTQEIIDTTKRILLDYKDKINQVIDSTISIVEEDTKITYPILEKKKEENKN